MGDIVGDSSKVVFVTILINLFLRFYINFNGDAFVCSQLMHYDPKKAREHYLGNLDTDINILDNYITCPKDYCPCKMDAIVDKYLP